MSSKEKFTRNAAGELKTILTWREWLTVVLVSWLIGAYIWLVRITARIDIVHGQDHYDLAVKQKLFIACAWHKRLFISGIFLLKFQKTGSRIGALISPSREGECIARVARINGAATMRGSSSRTGRDALNAIKGGLSKGICPVMFADGPRGPAGQCKAGTLVASQKSGAPILAVGCDINRYWELNTWDKFIIPKPFARLKIAVGELCPAPIGKQPEEIDELSRQMGLQLNALTAIAEAAD